MKDIHQEETELFIGKFREYLGRVDNVAQMVRKGHLEVEAELDDVLKAILFHPEHLRESRLTFHQKVHVVRAYALRKSDAAEWRLMAALNSLRNDIAHGQKSEKRSVRIAELRQILSGIGAVAFQGGVKKATEEEIVVYAAAVCNGFLLLLKDYILALRRCIEDLDRRLNPHLQKVASQARVDE